MANKKLEDAVKKLAERYGILNNKNLKTVSVGLINKPDIVEYAKVYEYGGEFKVKNYKQHKWFEHNLPKDYKQVPQMGNKLVHPPRPFLRFTAAAKAYEWKQELKKALKEFNGNTEAALSHVGRIAAVDIQKTLETGHIGGYVFEKRRPLTLDLYKQAMKGHKTDDTGNISGDKPGMLTGAMHDNISFNLDE